MAVIRDAGAVGGSMKAGDPIGKFFGSDALAPDVADYADKALPRRRRNVLQNGELMPPAIGPMHRNDRGSGRAGGTLTGTMRP